jgi:hypothetical protein
MKPKSSLFFCPSLENDGVVILRPPQADEGSLFQLFRLDISGSVEPFGQIPEL